MLATCYLRQDPGIPPGMDALEDASLPVLTICGKDITATWSSVCEVNRPCPPVRHVHEVLVVRKSFT